MAEVGVVGAAAAATTAATTGGGRDVAAAAATTPTAVAVAAPMVTASAAHASGPTDLGAADDARCPRKASISGRAAGSGAGATSAVLPPTVDAGPAVGTRGGARRAPGPAAVTDPRCSDTSGATPGRTATASIINILMARWVSEAQRIRPTKKLKSAKR